MIAVVDIEADELLDKVSKIHCLCYYDTVTGISKSLTGYQEMRDFIMQKDLVMIGHNIVRYDVPVMNKILEIKVKATLVDTLPLSWTLYSQYLPTEHSLEDWGEFELRVVPFCSRQEWSEMSQEGEEYKKKAFLDNPQEPIEVHKFKTVNQEN